MDGAWIDVQTVTKDPMTTTTMRDAVTTVKIPVVTWNVTAPLEKLPLDSNFAWLLCALFLSMSWVVYITYYNSRLIGFIVTKILNRFYKKGYIKIGSLSISVLTGKILFRDVAFISEDFTVRSQDGWIIFRWWIPYVKKCPNEDFSHSETRLSILLNGFELHTYNRSQLYAKLERLFGMDPKILPGAEESFFQDSGEADTQTALVDSPPQEGGYEWRDLIPVIKVDVTTGRLVFGNRLLPTTLSICFEEAHLVYTSKPAPSLLDHFTHIAKCRTENFKVLLAPSPKYTGISDEPPRYMGEGFVVLQSNYVDLYYYQDEPGNVRAEPETIELANGDIVQRTTAPLWGLDIKCGKGTDFSYGPWADRQREQLFKFFFPQDYQTLVPTKEAKLREKRKVQSFDIRLSLLTDATIDILFSKEKETNAIHMNIGPGSYMEVTIPWMVQEQGFSTKINGQLLHLEASTSLQYRSLVDSETLQYDIQINYPRVWNEQQTWTCNLTGCKATVNLIYAIKEFFNSMTEDWGSRHRPDLLHFVPYTVHFSLILKEFELILVTNEHNWIDCSSQQQENVLLSICGDLFDLSFDLPFVEFLPQIIKFKFWIQGECVSAWMYIPEANSNKTTLSIVEKCAKLTNRDGTIRQENTIEKKWSNIVNKSSGWIECWEVPIVALSIGYTFHPSPPVGSKWMNMDITTPEREELLLSPIRPCSGISGSRFTAADFNPISMDPDLIQVDLEVGPSVLRLYGSFLCLLIHLKDNYFGEYQTFMDFDSSPPILNGAISSPKDMDMKDFDPRQYRPLEVKVSVTLHDIQGHIMKECRPDDPPCPCLHMERMGFEMLKTYQETKLQLLFSPLVLSISDTVVRPESHKYLQGGHLALSALQVRGHAMFSNAGRTLDQETLEYAWLVEIQLGDITGRLTSIQLLQLMSVVETFIFQLQQTDSCLQPSQPYKQCQHSLQQQTCSEGTDALACPCPEDVKYRMTRFSLDALDLCLVETGTAIEIEMVPLRLAVCNLHGKENFTGASALIHRVIIHQYILAGSGQDHSHMPYTDTWLEIGKISLGPIFLDNVISALHGDMHTLQNNSLKKHDEKTKRLWFLWPIESNIVPQELSGKCGCVGGCAFFGNNRNGICFFQLPGPTEDRYTCSARFCILTDNDFGFGQSLLHEGEYIFDVEGRTSNSEVPTPGSGLQGSFTFTEGYLNRPYQKTPNLSPKRHSDSSIGPAPREIVEEVTEVYRPAFISRSVDRKHSSSAVQGSQDELMALPEGGGRRMFRQFSSPGHSCSTLLAPPENGTDSQLIRKGSGSGRRRERGSSDSGLIPKRHLGSHQSLSEYENLVPSSTTGRGISPNSVRRAISTESTHSSEAYFSADEESSVSSSTLEDRDTTVIEAERPKYHPQKSNGSIDRKLLSGTRQTLHDIDEHPIQCEAELASDTSSLQRSLSSGTHDRSESNSVSSTSFISAVSSQEDVALVDLHNQMDKPILESPLLMSCYTAHMSQLQCFQWNEPPPLPHLTQQEGIPQGTPNKDQLFHCSASKWKPKFVTITEGFTAIRMVDKSKGATQSWEKKASQEREFVPGMLQCHHRKRGEEESPEEKILAKSTVVIKVKGDIDIVVSPLMLESMKSFVEALETLLETLHPLTIINHLHWSSVNKVEGQNLLKKEKLFYLCQLQNETLAKTRRKNTGRKSITSNTDSLGSTANYEDTKKEYVQGFLDISTINLSIIQASVVEEIISFAALDNVKDLTCASVLAVRIDSIFLQSSLRRESRRCLQTFIQHGAEVKLHRKASERKKNKPDSFPSELVTVERQEVGLQEWALSAAVKRVHIQLRRLKNSSSVLKDAILTVIPFHRSSVGFTYEKVFLNLLPRSAEGVFLDRDWDQKLDEEKMGFIMFECGTEDLSIKLMNCKCSLPESGTFSVMGKDITPSPKQEQPDSGMGGSNLPASKSKSDGSWEAKNSFPSTFSECSNSTLTSDPKKKGIPAGNSSSFVVELKMVWLNFAAPPHTPNTRRIDFTRLDWHLLSTATPSLNSWLKAGNRFHVALRRVCRVTSKRLCAVMGCLMAEALERNDIHMPIKQAKYLTSKLTPIAKTLQEDPSCQLLMILKRFLRSTELTSIEENLSPEIIPPTEVLHRGIIALSRQWKNIVYVPDLVEHNYRLQKGIHSYSVPYNLTARTAQEDPEKVSFDECEVTDETTNLLMAEGGSIFVTPMPGQDNTAVKSSSTPDINSSNMSNQENSGGNQLAKGMKRKLPSYPPRSSRASVAFPLLGGPLESPARYGNLVTKPSGFAIPHQTHQSKGKKHDNHHSFKSTTWSFSSIEPNILPSSLDTPKKAFDLDEHHRADHEDLYNWMARQQNTERGATDYNVPNILQQLEQESKNNTTTSENSYEGRVQAGVFPLAPFSLGLHIADASMIFKHLLTSLGIPDNFSPSLMEQLGCKVSGSVTVELLRMDIVESEYTGVGSKQKKKVPRHPYNVHSKLYIDTSMDTPAFVCDKFSLEMELTETSNGEILKKTNIQMPGNGHLFPTTLINFHLNTNYIAQQVNMPLLRLIHQCTSMYENLKEVQSELKANRPHSFKTTGKDPTMKQSPSVTESNAESLRPQSPQVDQSESKGKVESAKHPHTLSQKLRTTCNAKGYVNLEEATTERTYSPLSLDMSESVTIDMQPNEEHPVIEESVDKPFQPRCWRTMIYLLDLYETMPETKTVKHRSELPNLQPGKQNDVSEGYKGNGKYEPLKEHKIDMGDPPSPTEKYVSSDKQRKQPMIAVSKSQIKGISKNLITHDQVPQIIFGVARIRRVKLLATLSGLKLEGELGGLHASLTHRQRLRGHKRWSESSLTGQLGQTTISVLEGIPPNLGIVVKMTVGKSQSLYSTVHRSGKGHNSGLLTIGPVDIDIPQHPVALHGMMTRSSRQLSTTLQELRYSRQPARTSRQMEENGTLPFQQQTKELYTVPQTYDRPQLLTPIVIQFSIILDSVTVGASLLPSLKAQYQMGQVTSMGITGSKAKFTVDLPKHTLSFNTKVTMDSNVPSSASVDLPPVHISAEYIQDPNNGFNKGDSFTDGVVLRQGSYLSALTEIGAFEHSLTTDLLNHLVLVQKVFMKEVNEVLQKMSGGDKLVPLWNEEEKTPSIATQRLLFSVQLRLKGIQITATTPTSSALRLETGSVELQLSNRVQNMSVGSSSGNNYMKLFGKAQVDVNLSLGQLIKNALFEEAEPEFQQFAYFKTRICLRNALQDEMISSQSEDKEAVLITLNRPLIYIQPIALDKAVMVWLNYKNAYEYWNEQRFSTSKEEVLATQQLLEKVPQLAQLGSQSLGTLFLQLTVDDMGICLPLSPYSGTIGGNKTYDSERRAAVVVTLENTRVSACSCGSLVSKARFTGLCLRFADDFETSLDDWKPDPMDPSIMNLCVVSEGTYEICSQTLAPQTHAAQPTNAKWILNVQWQMEGVDIHMDTNIGKQLSALFKTLTALTGEEDDTDETDAGNQPSQKGHPEKESVGVRKCSVYVESLPPYLQDPSLDSKRRSRLIEKEMNEQARIINDLRLLGASQSTIETEMRRLQELEAAVFNDFRRDVIKRLRRQSVKATSFRDKLGLGNRGVGTPHQANSMVFPEDIRSKMGLFNLEQMGSSQESSPTHSHTRTGSLDITDFPNMEPDKRLGVHRELSLDSVFTTVINIPDPTVSETSTPSHGVDGSPKMPQLEPLPTSPSTVSSEAPTENDFPSLRVVDEKKKVFTSPGHYKLAVPEPSIDFELDVKVVFNSGKCVLHTKEASKDFEEQSTKRSMKKERSFSGGLFDSSPSHSKKRHGSGLRLNASATKLRYLQAPLAGQIADFTILLIPGLDIKVHYNSKTVSGESPISSGFSSLKPSTHNLQQDVDRDHFVSFEPAHGQHGLRRTTGVKKASLFAWMTLQSIPEEAVVSPHILDFLEQALEPIPLQLTKPSVAQTDVPNTMFANINRESSVGAMATPSQYAYASFPVDVIVYFRMQPSIVRFSCLPISRVECLLRLPSVELVFSSKRTEGDQVAIVESSPMPRWSVGSDQKMGHTSVDENILHQTATGGLSMTGSMADFSLYIFHPYGGAKKSASSTPTGSNKESSETLSSSERKGSLSLQVEFVKVNISRSRKLSRPEAGQKGMRLNEPGAAVIRFSAVCDIGSASFKYDMRRLTEILAFPKAWYRRSIARRMFLGDQSSVALYSDLEDSLDTSSSSGTLSPSIGKSDYFVPSAPQVERSRILPTFEEEDPNRFPSDSAPPSSDVPFRAQTSNREKLRLNFQEPLTKIHAYDQYGNSSPVHAEKQGSAWETLVLFAVNLSKLSIHMNMGNVMGNTTWLTRDFKSQGRLSIGSNGHKNLFVSLGLEGSSLDSKGGIVGGTIELSQIETSMHLKEDWNQEPDHTVAINLSALESRLDYMGTSVLMGRVSSFNTTLKDEWQISTRGEDRLLADHPTKRPALIFVHGDLGWDQMQLLISKSTTSDIMKMCAKLEEFFSQQFHSSKRVFSSLQPHNFQYRAAKTRPPRQRSTESPVLESEARHHRHWQSVLKLVSGLQLSTMPFSLPRHGTILGGTMDLHGKNISLACFHGVNFRSKSWAIFSLRDPNISFATEAQDISTNGSIDTHIVQDLSFGLGQSNSEHLQHASMATVCRISRNVFFPPQFRTMHEWFHYAFSSSEMDDVSRFPELEHEREGVSPSERRASLPLKGPEFSHNMEVIFALPSMQLHLKTEHLQANRTPTLNDTKPTVECSFVTEFDDHIFVSVDAEAFYFLHDLITAYLKEKESSYTKSQSPDTDWKRKVADPTETLQKDWRNYACHTWHLEPTVRLLSWAGKGIEPYGVDYILQKLGFAHARVTIPKWMQRGCMDPLDKILSVVMRQMISAVRNDGEEKATAERAARDGAIGNV